MWRLSFLANQQPARHPRSFGRGETTYDPWHYVPVLARKPGALRNGAPFKDWVLPAAIEPVRRKLADDGSVVHQGVKLEADRCLNAYAERLIGSIHRECLDHIVVFGHLRHVLLSYMDHQSGTRTRLLLTKDAPISPAVEPAGRILGRPILGGLHRQYGRI